MRHRAHRNPPIGLVRISSYTSLVSQTTAQIILTLILLFGAITFVLLGADQLAVALVGAIAGQGASGVVRSAVNGNK